ncbi:MAG: DNA-binding response regulator [Subtercola sp.]|nr:DNA-binding response regulator [Subtercola sp.]
MSNTTDPIRVVVADDQVLFIYGIRMLIDSQSDLELVGSATDGKEAVRLVEELCPDIVLMDIRMPVMDGIEATYRITQSDSEKQSRVVILTTFQREEAVFRAMKHGASAFITKDATPEFVLETIRAVHTGDRIVDPAATIKLVNEFADPDASARENRERAIAALSPREQEIFLLAARGLSNSNIAATAFISEATTKSHIRSILNKLQLQSRVQIVVYAYENGLLRS